MNTVKRWLAGFLSFAMIFTSSAFANVGMVYAAAVVGEVEKDAAAVELTIGSTTTYVDTLNNAIAEANKDKTSVSKEVTIKLLKDNNSNLTAVERPLTIDFNGFACNGTVSPAEGGQSTGKYTIGGKAYTICTGAAYSGGVRIGYRFAAHETTRKYVWGLASGYEDNPGIDPTNPIWVVTKAQDECGNCGIKDGTLPKEGSFPLYSNFYNEELKQYEYREWTSAEYVAWCEDKGINAYDEKSYKYFVAQYDDQFLKDTMSAEGYSIVDDGPLFVTDGSRVRHGEDGKPVVSVKVVSNADGSEVKDPDVSLAVATTAERTYNPYYGIRTEDGVTGWTLCPAGFLASDATCKTYGTELYKVIVKDPDGKELVTRYVEDSDGNRVAHEAGTIKKVQFLRKVGNSPKPTVFESKYSTYEGAFYKTEGEARDAAATFNDGKAVDVVMVTAERFDNMNGDQKYTNATEAELDGVKDTTAYYFWYWADEYAPETAATATFDNQLTFAKEINGVATTPITDDGSFQYRVIYNCIYTDDTTTEITGKAIVVKPMDKIANPTDFDANYQAENTNYLKPTFSTCTEWNYDGIDVDFNVLVGKAKKKYTATFYGTKTSYTDVNGKSGNSYFFKQAKGDLADHELAGTPSEDRAPTCAREGLGSGTCKYCGNPATVKLDKLTEHSNADGAHYDEAFGTPASWVVDDELLEEHRVVLNLGGNAVSTVATVVATCTEKGGEYLYCAGEDKFVEANIGMFLLDKGGISDTTAEGAKKITNAMVGHFWGEYNPNYGHWYLSKEIPAKGHKLQTTVTVTSNGANNTSFWRGASAAWATYDSGKDYVFVARRKCDNEDDMFYEVRYHSVDGVDTESDIYNAVDVVVNAAGEDCITKAKTTYTVDALTDAATKKAVTIGFERAGTVEGAHNVNVKSFKWTNDFEKATGVGTCKLCTKEGVETEATVTQETSTDGITTYTATANGVTETKKAFSLKKAVVTFDATTIEDGNYLNDETYGGDLPDVTVTINGTVIDPKLYETAWVYSPQKKLAIVYVDWTEAVKKSGKANYVVATKTGSAHVDAGKQFDAKWTYELNGIKAYDPETYAAVYVEEAYDPANTYKLVPVVIPDDAAIKYAVVNKEVQEGKDYWKRVKALAYDKDEVVVHDAGEYYVYAQLSADGYTTYYDHVATFIIGRPAIYVQIDDLTVTVGEDAESKLTKRAYWAADKDIDSSAVSGGKANTVADVDWGEDFVITTVGGKALKDLDAGVYKLNVQAPNYSIVTVNETHIGTLTVEPKDQSVVDAEKIAEELANATTDDALAAAYAKYAALSDELKKVVESNNAAKANLEKAKTAYDNKQAADKAAKELADAKAAANTALSAANAYASDANIKALIDALNAAIAKGDAAAIKTATANLNNAVDAKKKADAKTKTTFTYKNAKKTIKASKVKKAKQKFTFKATAKSGGKVTYKKASGSKKVTINSKGKVTVKKGTKKGTYKIKVKCTAAAKGNFLKTTVTKQITVKVK